MFYNSLSSTYDVINSVNFTQPSVAVCYLKVWVSKCCFHDAPCSVSVTVQCFCLRALDASRHKANSCLPWIDPTQAFPIVA